MALNARVVPLSIEIASMNTKDAVKAIFGEIHHDPKSGDDAMNCFLSCWSYQNNKNNGSWKFVVDKKNGAKYTIAEILDYTKAQDHRIVQILKNEDTMTFIEIKAGDVHKDVYVIIETHCVVMGFDLNVVFNCQKEYEEIEVGIWESFTGWVKKDVLGQTEERKDLPWHQKLKEQHIQNFNHTYGDILGIIKPSEPKIIDKFLVQQEENFKGMKYGERFENFKKTVIADDSSKSFLENLKEQQVKNFKEMEYPKKISNFVDTIIGTEEVPFFKQHEKNFKDLWVKKLAVFGVNSSDEITIRETLAQQQRNFMSSYGGIALNKIYGSIQETDFDKFANAVEKFDKLEYSEKEALFEKMSDVLEKAEKAKANFLEAKKIEADILQEKAELERALAESKKMYDDIKVPEVETVVIMNETVKVCTENVPQTFKGTKEYKKLSPIFVGKCGDIYVWVRPDMCTHFYKHVLEYKGDTIACLNNLCEESLSDIAQYTYLTCMRTENSFAFNESTGKFLNLIESKAKDPFYNSVMHPIVPGFSIY